MSAYKGSLLSEEKVKTLKVGVKINLGDGESMTVTGIEYRCSLFGNWETWVIYDWTDGNEINVDQECYPSDITTLSAYGRGRYQSEAK